MTNDLSKCFFKSDISLMDFLVGVFTCLLGTVTVSAFLVLLAVAVLLWAISEQGYYLYRLHVITSGNAMKADTMRRYKDVKVIFGMEIAVLIEFAILDL